MMNSYEHGGDIYGYSQDIIDFSSNINPLGPPPAVRSAYEQAFENCMHYPDPFCRELCEEIAQHEGVLSSQIVCGNGAADLIYRIIAWYKPKRALITAPAFSEYEQALKLFGCSVERYCLNEKNNFNVDEVFAKKICNVDIVFLCNPANPVGNTISHNLMRKFAQAAVKSGTLLVIDECFLDFLIKAEELTAKPFIENGHVIILKAFTKTYSMPGLRLGYCIATNNYASLIRAAGQPWPVSVPAQLCGIAAIQDKEYLIKTREYIRAEYVKFKFALEKLGFRLYSSQANFVFVRHINLDLKDMLLRHNILIRDCSNYHMLEKGYYRFAIKKANENDYLFECIEKTI